MKQLHEDRNPYGYATNEYWQFEAERHGYRTPQAWLQAEKAAAPRCPHCGTPQGFAFGTGDCGCDEE